MSAGDRGVRAARHVVVLSREAESETTPEPSCTGRTMPVWLTFQPRNQYQRQKDTVPLSARTSAKRVRQRTPPRLKRAMSALFATRPQERGLSNVRV